MKKVDLYKEKLKALNDWEGFLLKESGLPGPRANLELVQAVAEEGNEKLFKSFMKYDKEKALVNSPYVFPVVCGIVGLGTLLSGGRKNIFHILRAYASDPRWRIREAVAMALQILGTKDMDLLLAKMKEWGKGGLLEKRAAAAALCEPKLLIKEEHIEEVIKILDEITRSIELMEERKSEEFAILKKGLGYCWSVAAAASPKEGKEAMDKWFLSRDKDILWIMKENIKKNRMIKMDKEWVEMKAAQVNRMKNS